MLFLDVTVQHVFLNGLFAAPPPRKMTLANEYFGEACPASAPFFGFMGAAAALIFASEFHCQVWFSTCSGLDTGVGWGVIKACFTFITVVGSIWRSNPVGIRSISKILTAMYYGNIKNNLSICAHEALIVFCEILCFQFVSSSVD